MDSLMIPNVEMDVTSCAQELRPGAKELVLGPFNNTFFFVNTISLMTFHFRRFTFFSIKVPCDLGVFTCL